MTDEKKMKCVLACSSICLISAHTYAYNRHDTNRIEKKEISINSITVMLLREWSSTRRSGQPIAGPYIVRTCTTPCEPFVAEATGEIEKSKSKQINAHAETHTTYMYEWYRTRYMTCISICRLFNLLHRRDEYFFGFTRGRFRNEERKISYYKLVAQHKLLDANKCIYIYCILSRSSIITGFSVTKEISFSLYHSLSLYVALEICVKQFIIIMRFGWFDFALLLHLTAAHTFNDWWIEL